MNESTWSACLSRWKVFSPKLTVAFSQLPYILVSYRVSTSGCGVAYGEPGCMVGTQLPVSYC